MKNLKVVLKWFGVIFLQLIASQLLTFAGSFFFPGTEQPGVDHPVQFAIMLGITFSVGFFLVGWLGLKIGWLPGPARLPLRLAGTLIGSCLVLLLGVLFAHTLPPGSPFFLVSTLAGLLGFHLVHWVKK